ncbi:hypothetical protein HRbin30_01918 [bacterium HR30]|nr:hypothetical protein HRbin30_01918 [bacterium HR30]
MALRHRRAIQQVRGRCPTKEVASGQSPNMERIHAPLDGEEED